MLHLLRMMMSAEEKLLVDNSTLGQHQLIDFQQQLESGQELLDFSLSMRKALALWLQIEIASDMPPVELTEAGASQLLTLNDHLTDAMWSVLLDLEPSRVLLPEDFDQIASADLARFLYYGRELVLGRHKASGLSYVESLFDGWKRTVVRSHGGAYVTVLGSHVRRLARLADMARRSNLNK